MLEHVSQNQVLELGLMVYLFIMGELIDAQQSRTMSHNTQMKIFWRTHFFIDGWLKDVLEYPHYTMRTHFLSCNLYNIIGIFINSMLALILTYCDYFPHVSFLSWMHSTECCEHFFGCAHSISKDFTLQDLVYMMPKLSLLINRDLRTGKARQVQALSHHSGYHHSWCDAKGLNYRTLMTYSSNDEILSEVLPSAYTEVKQLLKAIGIAPSRSSLPHITSHPISDTLRFSNPQASSLTPALIEDEELLATNDTDPDIKGLAIEDVLLAEAITFI